MYRVYDNKKKQFVDNIFLSQDDRPFKLVRRMLLPDKLVEMYDMDADGNEKFTIQYDTGMVDKYYHLIYEGDICKVHNTGDDNVIGVVAWSNDIGSYCAFDYNNSSYYVLTENTRDNFEIIDNVCDGDYPFTSGGEADDGDDS